MAATVETDGCFVQISAIDADWTWTTTFPNHAQGIKVDWIAFKPGGTANDKLSMKMDSDTGVECFPSIPRSGPTHDLVIYYYGGLLRPVIDLSASTFTTGHQVTIKLANNSGD